MDIMTALDHLSDLIEKLHFSGCLTDVEEDLFDEVENVIVNYVHRKEKINENN